MEWLSWGRDREGEQGRKYLDKGRYYRVSRNLVLEELLGIHKDDPS